MVRGGRDVEEHARPAERLLARGPTGVPDILANAHADEGAAEVEDRGSRTLPEIAILVEDAVVRQVTLAVAVDHLATGYHGAGVVQVGVKVHKAHCSHHILGNPPGELAERP